MNSACRCAKCPGGLCPDSQHGNVQKTSAASTPYDGKPGDAAGGLGMMMGINIKKLIDNGYLKIDLAYQFLFMNGYLCSGSMFSSGSVR